MEEDPSVSYRRRRRRQRRIDPHTQRIDPHTSIPIHTYIHGTSGEGALVPCSVLSFQSTLPSKTIHIWFKHRLQHSNTTLGCKCGYPSSPLKLKCDLDVLLSGTDRRVFMENMLRAGYAGLDQFLGADIFTCYITGYQCKGNESPTECEDTVTDVAKSYSKKDKEQQVGLDEQDESQPENAIPPQRTTMASVTAASMNRVMSGSHHSKQFATFCLAGGKLMSNLHWPATRPHVGILLGFWEGCLTAAVLSTVSIH